MSILSKMRNVLTSKGNLSNLSQIANTLKKSSNVPQHLQDTTQDMVSRITEYMQIREIEQTKREEIVAQKEVALAAINTQKELILDCMRHCFAERAAVLQKNFKVIDTALEKGDLSMLNLALSSMVQVIQSSPFQAIQQVVEAKGTLRLE